MTTHAFFDPFGAFASEDAALIARRPAARGRHHARLSWLLTAAAVVRNALAAGFHRPRERGDDRLQRLAVRSGEGSDTE